MILKHRLKGSTGRPDIQIIKDYADNLPSIECFIGPLNQVFVNLLANAIDALEESDRGLTFEQIQQHPNQIYIQTALAEDGNHVIIRIKDNGVGMSSEIQGKIFDHLFTTKGVNQGTGLGLSITKHIILEKHGGTLAVNSAIGAGSEFTIALPITAGVEDEQE
jgi:signal transduction histidine kinase